MVFRIYHWLMRLGTPALTGYLGHRRRIGKEDALRANERKGIASVARPDGFVVWAHAASNGEALSLLPVISRLIADNPHLHAVVTTGTVTSARLMAQRLPERAVHQYVPVDHPAWVNRFLNHWKPDLVLWAESDFWPNMLTALRERRVPSVLLNARMSARSFKRWMKMPKTAKQLLSTFGLCFAQNDTEAERLRSLGMRDVRMQGNLKYAAEPLPAPSDAREAFAGMLNGRPALLWASTHEGEEEIAIRLHTEFVRQIDPNFLTVIVPRHPRRADAVARLLDANGVSWKRRGHDEVITVNDGIYLADTTGELGVFFANIPLVAMGGSFGSTGGHNPIEPAQFGATVFFGPSRHNFVTMVDAFVADHAMILAGSEQELAEHVIDACKNPDAARNTGFAAKAHVAKQAAVLDAIIEELRPLIKGNNA